MRANLNQAHQRRRRDAQQRRATKVCDSAWERFFASAPGSDERELATVDVSIEEEHARRRRQAERDAFITDGRKAA